MGSVNRYKIEISHCSYSMHITLRMEGLDLDTLLQQHPLDGREEIRNGITGMVQSYLRPLLISREAANINFNSLWFDPTLAQTHDLPYMRQAC
jgi:hypothetical protein